jgi:adenylate cyclase
VRRSALGALLATLGRFGFERRFDYAAGGMVVSLATRLCDEAADGQILVGSNVRAAVESLAATESAGELRLKASTGRSRRLA